MERLPTRKRRRGQNASRPPNPSRQRLKRPSNAKSLNYGHTVIQCWPQSEARLPGGLVEHVYGSEGSSQHEYVEGVNGEVWDAAAGDIGEAATDELATAAMVFLPGVRGARWGTVTVKTSPSIPRGLSKVERTVHFQGNLLENTASCQS